MKIENKEGIMPDKKYDAVIVGGGHHATIIACYLQRAGLKTAMFERWHEMGGGACGEELPLPGFIQNVCAHFTRFYTHPAYQDFNLRDYGLVYTFPENNEAWIYPDGNYILAKTIFPVVDSLTGRTEFSPEAADFVVKEVSKINKDDGNTVEEIIRRYAKKWKAAYVKYRFSGPAEWPDGPDPLEALADDPKDGMEPDIAFGTVGYIATKLFKSPEMQTFYMRAMQTSNGFFPQDRPGPYWNTHVLGLVLSMDGAAICTGGTHSITHALLRAFEELGGEFFVLSEVKRVLVDNNKAYGIELTNGDRILADVVVSDLNTELTIDAAGKENWPPEIWAKAQKLKEKPVNIYDDKGYERTQLLWGNIALVDAPVYPQNPQLGYVPRLYFGKADPDYFLSGRYQKERWELGIAKQLYLLVAPDVQWDPTRAPEGRFTALVEEFTCPWRNFSERDWLRMKKEIEFRMVEEWGKYAPNVTMDNFLGGWIATPDDVVNRNPCMPQGGWGGLDSHYECSGRNRPMPELSKQRMPIKNYYMCGMACHPAHGIGRGNSYNCYKLIAQDFGLKYKPWEERGW
jgi:phytoene dehydrogenase-like protein